MSASNMQFSLPAVLRALLLAFVLLTFPAARLVAQSGDFNNCEEVAEEVRIVLNSDTCWTDVIRNMPTRDIVNPLSSYSVPKIKDLNALIPLNKAMNVKFDAAEAGNLQSNLSFLDARGRHYTPIVHDRGAGTRTFSTHAWPTGVYEQDFLDAEPGQRNYRIVLERRGF